MVTVLGHSSLLLLHVHRSTSLALINIAIHVPLDCVDSWDHSILIVIKVLISNQVLSVQFLLHISHIPIALHVPIVLNLSV